MAIPNGNGGFQDTSGNLNEMSIVVMGNPSSYAVPVTLLPSDFASTIIIYSGATGNLMLPLVSDLEAVVTVAKSNYAFFFNIIATGAGTATLTANTGWVIVGSAAVVNGTSARFAARKMATGSWALYRVA